MTNNVTQSQGTSSTSQRLAQDAALVEAAKRTLRARVGSPRDLLKQAKQLKNVQRFDLACRILALARQQPTNDDKLRYALAQQHALCTYKNPDAPLTDRLDDALAMLEREIDLRTTVDQETLGIAGAIFKRKWQADGDKEHLETSLEYYYRGFDLGPETDQGYTGINAACVLDLLADIEARQAARTGAVTSPASSRTERAKHIRQQIISALLRLHATDANAFEGSWWAVVTLAEAYFGIQDFSNAGVWLERARQIEGVPAWEVDATAQQLATLARLQGKVQVARQTKGELLLDPLVDPQPIAASPAWELLARFFELPHSAIRSAALGKIGLALSGGGFRASLFHIGVLAALAEHDLLRHVEVLSCVSGGSIIGTHYYLELRRLLQSTPDGSITAQDYVDILKRIEDDFLAGVQQNIRMRVFADVIDNWRMFFGSRYSRTQKVGELYEQQIYSRIPEGPPAAAARGERAPNPTTNHRTPRCIGELQIRPSGTDVFNPKFDNWRREAKVPMLAINTSALNSGHQWQFTTSFMGEPPSSINTNVDGNYRLRRMYYKDAPPPYRSIRLGHAVGASSCVPGLFEPMQLRDLFPKISVTLVDGGVHDNQGILSLLEQSCDNLIISDASGQMGESDHPSTSALAVLYRSDAVFQARMRDIQFRDLTSRIRGGVVSATYMHLKQDLEVTAKDWVGCDDPKENPAASTSAVQFTQYDIRKDVQRLLADVRTDLDSFCDAEAHALMRSCYKMTLKNLRDRGWGGSRTQEEWSFLYIDEAMRRGDARLMAILRQAGSLGFKVWGLLSPLRIIGRTALVLALIAAAVVAVRTWNDPIPFVTLGGLMVSGLILVLTAALGPAIGRILNAPGWLKRAALGVGAGLFGWAVVFVHLRWFDRWYLAYGSRSKFSTHAR
jgi:predicted acylesterase/phospholipase RssA